MATLKEGRTPPGMELHLQALQETLSRALDIKRQAELIEQQIAGPRAEEKGPGRPATPSPGAGLLARFESYDHDHTTALNETMNVLNRIIGHVGVLE